MNNNSMKFGIRSAIAKIASGLLAATIIMFVPAQTTAAHAAPNIGNVDGSAATTLVIHKFEQPNEYGQNATGLEQATNGMTPVSGAVFTAKKVPGIDLTKNVGWDRAQEITVAEAKALIGSAMHNGTATTNQQGDATINLEVGVYLVEETHVPAGVVATDPFLVALPMPHPTTDEWLYTVHIYPKNPRVTIDLTVIDQDAVKLGDTVYWESRSTIPKTPEIDAYVVQNLIDPKLKLSSTEDQIKVTLPGSNLERGKDYTVNITTIDGKEAIEVTFSETGRQKLTAAREKSSDVTVNVEYETIVLDMGILENQARVLPDQRAVDGITEPVTDEEVTKWGPLSILVHERGNPSNLIKGAKFKLYLTPEDAMANRNPIIIDGVSEWTTDEKGFLTIDDLRFSNFVNGLDRSEDDPLYRYYYAMPQSYPPGWTGEFIPLQGSVHSVIEAEVLLAVVWKGEEPPKPELPLTGGEITAISVAGIILLTGGVLLAIVSKRRRKDTEV